jgi:hypothetical protein
MTIEEKIELALAAGGDVMTFADLVELARAGRVQLWGNRETLVATEILTYPRKRALNAFMVAGSVEGVFRLQDQIVEFARDEGCHAIVAHGRRAWGRLGRAGGWREHSTCFVLPLELLQ